MSEIDPAVQRAYDLARAVLSEQGRLDGLLLVCEISGRGLVIAYDEDLIGAATLADALRKVVDRIS